MATREGPDGDGRVTGFWHGGVTVSDLAASIAFYCDALGLAVARRGPASSAAQQVWQLPGARGEVALLTVPGSDVVIELIQVSGVEQHPAAGRPCDPGVGHLCFYVEDLAALHARLVARGYHARSAEVVRLEDGSSAGATSVYMLDPDGYHVELFERPPAVPR
jgi:lactoylglutathione lyase